MRDGSRGIGRQAEKCEARADNKTSATIERTDALRDPPQIRCTPTDPTVELIINYCDSHRLTRLNSSPHMLCSSRGKTTSNNLASNHHNSLTYSNSTSIVHYLLFATMNENNFEVAYINEDQTCATFKFFNEDHTLANVLRSQILENQNVEFCGYSIPHPSEEYFQMQIQTKNGLNVYDALTNGFEELSKLCDKTKKLFVEAVEKHNMS